eukprot:TRINITY_DN2722_c0_g3_i2.p1 TRINITY_DN2722_c0_g3~~TRINITY_DN2722_c0_g3_i2.p1  ORF type:complete len:388 (+),score=86.80 TRINITY_DN2722_c0_g3_i2:303-1466(+)
MSAKPPPVVLSSESARSGEFGSSVAASDSFIVVGRPTCIMPNGCDGGRAAVFSVSQSGELNPHQMLYGPDLRHDSRFGRFMHLGTHWLAITTITSDYAGVNTGLVILFSLNANTNRYTQRAGLRPKARPHVDIKFGHAVATSQTHAVVGAPGFDHDGTSNFGCVMHFRLHPENGLWGRTPFNVEPSDLEAGDHFGHAVAVQEALLVASNDPQDAAREAVYVFTRSGARFLFSHKIQQSQRAGFGWALVLDGTKLYVSAIQDTVNSVDSGSVTIFDQDQDGVFAVEQTIAPESPEDDANFGYSLSLSGSRLLVGTNTCPIGSSCSLQGKAYLFTENAGTWNQAEVLVSDVANGSDGFGRTVAVTSTKCIVGAPLVTARSHGAAWVFIE